MASKKKTKKKAPVRAKKPKSKDAPQPDIEGMSIIISAWNATEHIGDCLDAFASQDNKVQMPLEILIGVDGCSETLELLCSIQLPSNTRVVWFPENHGPYIVFNTLVPLAQHPYVMFFGADDIPYPFLADRQALVRQGVDIVRQVTHDKLLAYGAFGIWKASWERVGGYEPWRCAADYEFIVRAERIGLTVGEIKEATFQRGIHPDQLSAHPETGMQSEIRKEYHELVKTSTKGKIEPETAEHTELFASLPMPKSEPTIGAAMIVKNESSCLDTCLSSLKGIDEIVVVDTGSDDGTPDIARKYTDKVSEGEYVWKDEFDDARNFAIARSTTDWILSIDADEVLEPNGIAKLRRGISEVPSTAWALSCALQAKGTNQINYPVRFWRNRRGLRFHGIGHEAITRLADAFSGVKIIYGRSEAHDRDQGRMFRIMTKAVEKEPNNARYKFYLAREHYYRSEWQKAIDTYELYLKQASWASEMAEARLRMARCHHNLGNWKEAKDNCLQAILINAEFKEALLFMAQMCGPNNAAAWKRYAKSATNKDVLFVRNV